MDVKLTDLITVSTLQKIQNGFSQYTGLAAIITDPNGVPITQGSGFTTFCNELTRKSELGRKLCEQCDRDGALITLKNGHTAVYRCHAGLLDFSSPIIIDGMLLGCCVGGQAKPAEIDDNRIKELALKYGIDPDTYVEAARNTKIIGKSEVEKAAYFLEVLANGISEMAYENYKALMESRRLEKISKSQADYVLDMSMMLENEMNKWFNIVEDTKNDSKEPGVNDMLSQMLDNGLEMRNAIKNTVDYIRMTASEIELSENVYKLKAIEGIVKKEIDDVNKNTDINITFELNDDNADSLFGDVGRIGQLISQGIDILVDSKKSGDVKIIISTEKDHYATNFCIELIDNKTRLSEEKIQKFIKFFEEKDVDFDSNETGMMLSFQRLLLRKLNGTLKLEHFGEDVIFSIKIPQLAV